MEATMLNQIKPCMMHIFEPLRTCTMYLSTHQGHSWTLLTSNGLHFKKTIWPLMNPPYNVPFWSPLAICNPFLKSNLKNNEKMMEKWWKTIEKITKKLRPEVLMLLEVSFKCQKLRNALYMFWEAQKYASCRVFFDLTLWPPLEDHLASNEPP